MDKRWDLTNDKNATVTLEQFGAVAQQLKDTSERHFGVPCSMHIRVMDQFKDQCSLDMFMDMFETVRKLAEDSTILRVSDPGDMTSDAWNAARSIDVQIKPTDDENDLRWSGMEYHADKKDNLNFYIQAGDDIVVAEAVESEIAVANKNMLLNGRPQISAEPVRKERHFLRRIFS